MIVVTTRIGPPIAEDLLANPPPHDASGAGEHTVGVSTHRQWTSVSRWLAVHGESDEDGSMHGKVWEEGTVTANFLRDYFAPLGLRGQSVVELGAGSGIAGLMAAMLGAKVLITDIDVAIPMIRYNSVINLTSAELRRVKAVCFEWGVTPASTLLQDSLLKGGRRHAEPDVILCAGVLYYETLVVPLCQALRALSGKGTGIFVFVRSRPESTSCQLLFLKSLLPDFFINYVHEGTLNKWGTYLLWLKRRPTNRSSPRSWTGCTRWRWPYIKVVQTPIRSEDDITASTSTRNDSGVSPTATDLGDGTTSSASTPASLLLTAPPPLPTVPPPRRRAAPAATRLHVCMGRKMMMTELRTTDEIDAFVSGKCWWEPVVIRQVLLGYVVTMIVTSRLPLPSRHSEDGGLHLFYSYLLSLLGHNTTTEYTRQYHSR